MRLLGWIVRLRILYQSVAQAQAAVEPHRCVVLERNLYLALSFYYNTYAHQVNGRQGWYNEEHETSTHHRTANYRPSKQVCNLPSHARRK